MPASHAPGEHGGSIQVISSALGLAGGLKGMKERPGVVKDRKLVTKGKFVCFWFQWRKEKRPRQ